MDYIYKDISGNKCIGEVQGIEVTPYYQFTIKINGKNVWCHMEHVLSEWCIHFIELEMQVELAYPADVYWNARALNEHLNDEDSSWRIAYAIKNVYEKYKYEDVSF